MCVFVCVCVCLCVCVFVCVCVLCVFVESIMRGTATKQEPEGYYLRM